MAERKATNKWIPPDFNPSKHGSVNGYHNSHPLRQRASRLATEGILTIRFEMPYNVWCLHCDAHIGMGVRYNAQKKTIGKYLSTPIFEFRMKCHLCSGWMVIHTDPKNTEYVCVEGVRRKVQEYTPAEGEAHITMESLEDRKRLVDDAFFKLEHDQQDAQKLQQSLPTLDDLQGLSDKLWKDDYANSKQLRRQFRSDKKVRGVEANKTKAIQDRFSLSVDLLPVDEEADAQEYSNVELAQDKELKQLERQRLLLNNSSIFGQGGQEVSKLTRNEMVQLELKRKRILELSNTPRPIVAIRKKQAIAPQKVSNNASSLVHYSDSDSDS